MYRQTISSITPENIPLDGSMNSLKKFCFRSNTFRIVLLQMHILVYFLNETYSTKVHENPIYFGTHIQFFQRVVILYSGSNVRCPRQRYPAVANIQINKCVVIA